MSQQATTQQDGIRRNLYLVVGAFIVIALGLGAAGYWYYLNQKAAIETDARHQLAAIAQLKVQQVVGWRRERLADARILAAGSTSAIPTLLLGKGNEQTRAAGRAWLEEICDAAGYANAVVVDRNGETLLAVGQSTNKRKHYTQQAKPVLESGDITFSDIHLDEGLPGPHLGLHVPLRSRPGGQPEGAMLLGIDPSQFLYPLIQSWPTPSQTAETLLARQDGNYVIYLNELRHWKGSALKLRLPLTNLQLPAARGVLGLEGLVDGLDYRGVPVLAAIRRVPDTPWVLIAKVDLSELYAPVRQQAFWLALIACAVTLAIGAGVVLLMRDFRLRFYQQRYEAEIERRALAGHYDYLSRFANDIILLTDQTGRIIEANDRAVGAYGYERAELIGMPFLQLRDVAAPEEFNRHWHALERQDSLIFETRHRRKDGSTFPVEVSARRIAIEGTEFRQAIVRDTTERSKLQEQLQQAQKMESVGRLAGGVAHDFNNLLTIITGYTSFALEELTPNDPLHGPMTEISRAGQRAASLTQQLLAFSRKQVIDPKVISLNEIIVDVCKMLGRLVGEDIEVVTTLEPSLGRVLADPGQMQQVLMNLATNARDAMPQGGTLLIETQNVNLGEEYVATHAGTAAGPYILLTVTDTGVGMDEGVQRQIFEPFFTTKPEGLGTGLGLATVYGVVKQSGGWIWVYSERGKGTTFKIYLPRASGQAEDYAAAPQTDSAELRGSETVLIVEDQNEVRQIAVEILNRQGYRVLHAANPSEALQVCECFSERIDLMITDVVMPGMNGRDLAERVGAQRPNLKVLYMSGYTENVIAHQGVLERGVAYLGKPFTPAELAEKVRQVLTTAKS